MADDHVTSVSGTPSDPTPYIRTYAKDVARLTGTQPAHVAPAKDAPTEGVKFDAFDASQTQGTRADSGSSRAFPQEMISVTKDDTIASLNGLTAEPPENKRDEILTRLRTKIQGDAATPSISSNTSAPRPFASILPSGPAPIVPVVSITQPAPVAPHAPEPVVAPVVPPPPAPIPAYVPPAAPAQAAVSTPKKEHHGFSFFARKPKPAPIKPVEADLHTFKSDFAEHLDTQKASTFSVLAAQSDARDTRAPVPKVLKEKKRLNIPLYLSAATLVILGIAVLGGAYWFVALRTPAAGAPFSVPSLIFADEKVALPANAASLAEAVMQVAQQPSVAGNVVVIYPTSASTDGTKGLVQTPQSGGPVIRQIFISAPDILLRNIDDSSTIGVINAANANAPFFVVHVSSYERTFAGMLGWEPAMQSDLSVLYPSPAATPVASSTAPQTVTAARFVDATVANHDVRVLKDGAGRTILIYGYREKQTLIIAKDEAAFTAILVRLAAASN